MTKVLVTRVYIRRQQESRMTFWNTVRGEFNRFGSNHPTTEILLELFEPICNYVR